MLRLKDCAYLQFGSGCSTMPFFCQYLRHTHTDTHTHRHATQNTQRLLLHLALFSEENTHIMYVCIYTHLFCVFIVSMPILLFFCAATGAPLRRR